MWKVSSGSSASLCFFSALTFSDLSRKLLRLQPASILLCCGGWQFNYGKDAGHWCCPLSQAEPSPGLRFCKTTANRNSVWTCGGWRTKVATEMGKGWSTRCGRQVVACALRRWDKGLSFQAGQRQYGRDSCGTGQRALPGHSAAAVTLRLRVCPSSTRGC